MKNLKFRSDLVGKIRDGSKTETWWLFDDKDLQAGDELSFIDAQTGEHFADAVIVAIREKLLGQVETEDFKGHETYKDQDDMLAHYREYYSDKVTLDTPVKMIDFRVLRFVYR